MDATDLNFLRETYRADYRIRQEWIRKYGTKYGVSGTSSEIATPGDIVDHETSTAPSHRRKREQLKYQRDRTIKKFDLAETSKLSLSKKADVSTLSTLEESENSAGLERLNAGLSRFLGVYNPMLSKTQKASVSIQDHSDLNSTTSVTNYGLEFPPDEFRRKQHWLKIYFEEQAKMSNLIKTQNANKGTASSESKPQAMPAKK